MKLSAEKKNKISEQILALLYSVFPEALFTSYVAREIARDEEFVKRLLLGLKKKNLVIRIDKNPKGKDYTRRIRWKLGDAAYKIYRTKQH